MAAGFIVYFLGMHLLNLSHSYNYRIYNAVIQLACIIMAILAYRDLRPDEFRQFTGVSMGVITSVVGVSAFVMFQFLFFTLSPDFMDELKQALPYIGQDLGSSVSIDPKTTDTRIELMNKVANYLTPFTTAFIVLLEGMGAGLVLSYLVTKVLLFRR